MAGFQPMQFGGFIVKWLSSPLAFTSVGAIVDDACGRRPTTSLLCCTIQAMLWKMPMAQA